MPVPAGEIPRRDDSHSSCASATGGNAAHVTAVEFACVGASWRRSAADAMPPPRRFNLLIVRGDGSRVLRASAPRWAVHATLGGLAVAILVGGAAVWALYADYALLRHQHARLGVFVPRLAEHQALVDLTRDRVQEARAE